MSGHRLYAAFHLCLVPGVGRGEILALRWADVDVDNRQVAVVQQLALERGRPVLKQLKTQSSDRLVTSTSTPRTTPACPGPFSARLTTRRKIVAGRYVVAGNDQATAVAQVVDVGDDGVVHLRPMVGNVAEHLHLVGHRRPA